MKRMILMALACCSLMSYAQQQVAPEQIPWMVERSESTEWYEAQIAAWEKVVAQEPENENAWYNLSKATRYANMDSEEGYAQRQALYERMGKAIPDTYIYHFCARDNNNDSIASHHLDLAYDLIPEKRKMGEECGAFIAYFLKIGNEKKMKEMACRYYQEQDVPSYLLRYNYNELQCLPPNAIYFGNGDAVLLPKMALQYGMGVHQDKLVICLSFLWLEKYYQSVCHQLGIAPENIQWEKYRGGDNWRKYLPDRVNYLIRKSGRPSYFSPVSVANGSELEAFKENLYNEGLVLRYSEEPYDNYAYVRQNLEQNIHLDYLVEPPFVIEPQWQSASALTFNYFVLLSPLIQKYKEWGNTERAAWLQNLLTKALEQSKMDAQKKAICQEYLNKYIVR